MKPVLLIPMAGRGRRFVDGGYDTPKQLIKVDNKTILEWSFESIDWKKCDCVFIVRRDMVDDYAIDDFLREKFGEEITIVIAEEDTEGSVCSCLLAKEYINNSRPLAITTLDVYFEPYFDPTTIDISYDGCILVFKAQNPGYSYSQIGPDGLVVRTAEKELISDQASVGLYCFSKGSDFVKYGEEMIKRNIRARNEFYIAPMYNLLIEDGLRITTTKIDKMFHMGTPQELEYFLENDLLIIKNANK